MAVFEDHHGEGMRVEVGFARGIGLSDCEAKLSRFYDLQGVVRIVLQLASRVMRGWKATG